MSDDLDVGNSRIAKACSDAWNAWHKPIIFIEHLRNFGDAMHSTIIVRHYRRARPDCTVIFGVSERYAPDLETLKSLPDGPHIIVSLPHGPKFPYDGPLRVEWVKYARSLPHVTQVITPSVHPWGENPRAPHHKRLGRRMGPSIADHILTNAGISSLQVSRRPVLPVDISDYAWADQFQGARGLTGPFVTMEYNSYSLGVHDLSWYSALVPLIKVPVVALAGTQDPQLPYAVDARGCSYRQAKVLIMRSRCFLGCASGNSFLCASEGCETPFIEVVEPHMSFQACGYITSGRHYEITGFGRTPGEIANIINRLIP